MNILAIDIGGTNVKVLVSNLPEEERRRFPSGPLLSPDKMVAGVKEAAKDWSYDVVTIGYPGRVRDGHIIAEPKNLGQRWVGFDFQRVFGRPVKIVNDAAMQALGSFQRGSLLFLGLGTGIGSALIVDGVLVSLEIGHLAYGKSVYEDYVGRKGRKRLGTKKWQKHVEAGVARLRECFHPDIVVLGGGEAKKLLHVPQGCVLGDNANAFRGGFRLWETEPKALRTHAA